MEEIIICNAPVPGEKQEEKFPGELNTIKEAVGACKAGAAISHLHVRDENLLQTADTRLFQRDVEEIHKLCPVIIEGSTGGAPEHTLDQRCVSFNVPGVEMGSLNLGSINMWDGVYNNRWDDMVFYAKKLKEKQIKPFLVVFDLSHFSAIEKLEKLDLISPPYIISIVFDVPNTLQYSDKYLSIMLNEIPKGSMWFLVRHHAKGAVDFAKAFELGGHIRVGFEDGPFLSDGKRAKSNIQLVEDIAAAATKYGRKVVTPWRTRELFGLPKF